MAEEDRSFAPGAAPANRAQPQVPEDTPPAAEPPGAALDDRNAAGLGEAGDLGASTPANVDIHDLGQDDKPEQEWGEEVDEGVLFSSNHSRRAIRTEAERGQGAKTRRRNKDIVSRRT